MYVSATVINQEKKLMMPSILRYPGPKLGPKHSWPTRIKTCLIYFFLLKMEKFQTFHAKKLNVRDFKTAKTIVSYHRQTLTFSPLWRSSVSTESFGSNQHKKNFLYIGIPEIAIVMS